MKPPLSRPLARRLRFPHRFWHQIRARQDYKMQRHIFSRCFKLAGTSLRIHGKRSRRLLQSLPSHRPFCLRRNSARYKAEASEPAVKEKLLHASPLTPHKSLSAARAGPPTENAHRHTRKEAPITCVSTTCHEHQPSGTSSAAAGGPMSPGHQVKSTSLEAKKHSGIASPPSTPPPPPCASRQTAASN